MTTPTKGPPEGFGSRFGPENIHLTARDANTIVYLLDRLCEYEEGVVESSTIHGELPRNDATSAREVMRSERVWQTCQGLMIKLGKHWGPRHAV